MSATAKKTETLVWPQRCRKVNGFREWRSKNAGRRYRVSESIVGGSKAIYACILIDNCWRSVTGSQKPPKRFRTVNAARNACQQHWKKE